MGNGVTQKKKLDSLQGTQAKGQLLLKLIQNYEENAETRNS